MPQFLNPVTAAIAASVAVPLLLLLYFLKLRRVPQPVGSTLLWKKAIQDLQVNSPFQRLRRNLLLLLQLLVLLALLLALARPVSEGRSIAGAKSVILIDRSASMNAADADGRTRLEVAKERAKALIDTMGGGDQATVIAFDDSAEVVEPFSDDPALLRAAVDDIAPTDRPTRLKTAYTLANANMGSNAVERLRDDPSERADVFLFSDGRVPAGDAADLSLRGPLTYERIGGDDAANLAVVAASVKRNYERPSEAQVFARVGNFGPEVAAAAVRVAVADFDPDDPSAPLDFEDVTTIATPVSVPPARWADEAYLAALEERDAAAANDLREAAAEARRQDSVDVTLDLPRAAVVRVTLVRADDNARPVEDALKADDVAYVVVPPPEPLSVLLVTEGNYFLQNLLETQGLDDPRVVPPGDYDGMVTNGDADDFDVTIFDNVTPESLPAAGTFVFSGQLPPADATGVAAVVNDNNVPLFYEGNTVLDWERDHPMLRGLSLNRVWAAEGRLVSLPLGAETLIEGDRGPMLTLERNGPRTHLIFTFDLIQSTWPRLKTFPYFAYQMFEFLAASEDVRVRESVRPGETVGVPRSTLERADVPPGGEIRVIGPIGGGEQRRTVRVDENGGVTLGPFDRVGVYRTEPSLPQFERIAVSLLDADESNLLPARGEPGAAGGEAAAEEAGADAGGGATGLRVAEWWWWLVAASVALLLVEWFVYTRRVAA